MTVRARHDGEWVRIDVEDTGIGIAAENLDQVFTEFFREKRPETKGLEGSGLGLAIVKRLTERAGGRLQLASELGTGLDVLGVPAGVGWDRKGQECSSSGRSLAESGHRDRHRGLRATDDQQAGADRRRARAPGMGGHRNAREGGAHLAGQPGAQGAGEAAAKDKPVYLICASGHRSAKGAKILLELGYTEVYSVSGGIQAWLSAGLPVKRG